MLKLKETVSPTAVVSKENEEMIWELIESVRHGADTENPKCDSLLKLAHKLGEVKGWTDQNT